MGDFTCTCGHTDGEHDAAAECIVEGCDCTYYEWDGQEDSP